MPGLDEVLIEDGWSQLSDAGFRPRLEHQLGQRPDEGVEAVGRAARREAADAEVAEFVIGLAPKGKMSLVLQKLYKVSREPSAAREA